MKPIWLIAWHHPKSVSADKAPTPTATLVAASYANLVILRLRV